MTDESIKMVQYSNDDDNNEDDDDDDNNSNNSNRKKTLKSTPQLNSNYLDDSGPSDTAISRQSKQGGKNEKNSMANLQIFLVLNTFRLVQMETRSIINSRGAWHLYLGSFL